MILQPRLGVACGLKATGTRFRMVYDRLMLFVAAQRRGDFEAVRQAASAHGKSHVALVLKQGLVIFQLGMLR